jgi:hypothetical protein
MLPRPSVVLPYLSEAFGEGGAEESGARTNFSIIQNVYYLDDRLDSGHFV